MRYAAFRSLDVTNGEGTGVSLFVQGCPFHCYQCFNSETWNFNSGKEWTHKTEDEFIELASRSYIKRISFLGGSPLCNENVADVLKVINKLKTLYPQKQIWVYTGYTWEEIWRNDDEYSKLKQDVLKSIDILVDGPFVYEKKDLSLAFRGSTNQRIIDVQKSIQEEKIVLWKNGDYH